MPNLDDSANYLCQYTVGGWLKRTVQKREYKQNGLSAPLPINEATYSFRTRRN